MTAAPPLGRAISPKMLGHLAQFLALGDEACWLESHNVITTGPPGTTCPACGLDLQAYKDALAVVRLP